jgi:hypothetical protein
MKWGVRKDVNSGYKSTTIRSALSRRANRKVDKGFDDWKENAKKRDTAIELGKQANVAKLAYEKDKSNKDLKAAYKSANKLYKKALSDNTTYRKGVVRQEVGKDASRKYLSEAKKIKKQLDVEPSNKQLRKQYDSLMSKHDVERANARRAVDVGRKRSQIKANMKRKMTISVKAAGSAAAIAAGTYAVNRYLNANDVTINGRAARLGAQSVTSAANAAKKVARMMDFLY